MDKKVFNQASKFLDRHGFTEEGSAMALAFVDADMEGYTKINGNGVDVLVLLASLIEDVAESTENSNEIVLGALSTLLEDE